MISKEPNEELWKAIIEWIRIQLKRKHLEKNIDFFNADLSKYGRREVKSMLETMTEKLIGTGEQKAIIRILKRRFGNVEPDLEKQLQTISSLEYLDNLIDFSLTCETLDEFKTKLIS